MRIKAIIFPGQGSQYVGMGKELCQASSLARQTFEEAEDILGFPLKQLCMQGKLPELTFKESLEYTTGNNHEGGESGGFIMVCP